MHSDARKDHILSSYGFKSAHWALFEETKLLLCNFFFELVETEQGQERAKALQKASLQETLKNELQHLPYCPLKDSSFNFPRFLLLQREGAGKD